jgi:hypothetical protein
MTLRAVCVCDGCVGDAFVMQHGYPVPPTAAEMEAAAAAATETAAPSYASVVSGAEKDDAEVAKMEDAQLAARAQQVAEAAAQAVAQAKAAMYAEVAEAEAKKAEVAAVLQQETDAAAEIQLRTTEAARVEAIRSAKAATVERMEQEESEQSHGPLRPPSPEPAGAEPRLLPHNATHPASSFILTSPDHPFKLRSKALHERAVSERRSKEEERVLADRDARTFRVRHPPPLPPPALPKVDTNCTAPSLIPTVDGNTVRSFSGTDNSPQRKEAQPLSHGSDIRLIQHLDASALGFGPEVALNWLFPYPLINPPPSGTARSLITRSFNGNKVRNFPTHGQLSAAQGNLTSCLKFDFVILNLFEPSAP